MVAWDRIILPDNQTVEISAFGGDELGRTGTTGFVDTRFAQRFGSAALISLIGALPAAAPDRSRMRQQPTSQVTWARTCATAPKASCRTIWQSGP